MSTEPGAGLTGYVALLRGINVGAANRVAMADLRRVLTAAGYAGVRTHLNSGNVVLRARHQTSSTLAHELHALLTEELALTIPVLTRSAAELADVVQGDPLGPVATDPARYLVAFLSQPPDPSRLTRLRSGEFAPEAVAIGDREIYAWCPGGVIGSALLKELTDARLGVVVTARNWRTVTRLAELTQPAAR